MRGKEHDYSPQETERLLGAISQTRHFVESIQTPSGSLEQDHQFNLIHTLDHLARLRHRLTQIQRIETVRRYPPLRGKAAKVIAAIHSDPDLKDLETLSPKLDALQKALQSFRADFRDGEIQRVGQGDPLPVDLSLRLDSVRWLQRTGYHLWRITERLRQIDAAERRGETG